MTLDEAIESFFSYMKITEDLPVFFVGHQGEIDSAIRELRPDLTVELSKGVPLPFEKVALFQKINAEDDIDEFTRQNFNPVWSVEVVERGPDSFKLFSEGYIYFQGYGYGWKNDYKMAAQLEKSGDDFRVIALDHWRLQGRIPKEAEAKNALGTALILAMISHPSNYIVKESPQLTPREARRIESGKRFPDAKRPRYIIVDHDVLVGMQKPAGTHASPIPHRRRGHWMRLSERCRHAKERGLEKVFVRDCYVGNRDFIVSGRRYQVLLDFQEQAKKSMGQGKV